MVRMVARCPTPWFQLAHIAHHLSMMREVVLPFRKCQRLLKEPINCVQLVLMPRAAIWVTLLWHLVLAVHQQPSISPLCNFNHHHREVPHLGGQLLYSYLTFELY